jgi:hypothetical protein
MGEIPPGRAEGEETPGMNYRWEQKSKKGKTEAIEAIASNQKSI